MARYGMIIDCAKCIGCYNCFLACQDEFCGNEYPGYTAAAPMNGHDWIKLAWKERGQYPKVKVSFFPKTCLHCENAKCVEEAENGAVYRRDDGIIIIDPVKSKGQKNLVKSCPYGAIHWNEEAQLPQKCSMCAHMLDNGEKVPRCVESCPMEAMIFGDLDDPNSEISKIMAEGKAEIPHPERGLDVKVRYLNRHKKFIAGTVIDSTKKECASGVTVNLKFEGDTLSTETNGFGDFEFEGLNPKVADYSLELVVDGKPVYSKEIGAKKDQYLGEINI